MQKKKKCDKKHIYGNDYKANHKKISSEPYNSYANFASSLGGLFNSDYSVVLREEGSWGVVWSNWNSAAIGVKIFS